MYAAFWRLLPGPTWLKVIICAVLLVAIFFLLMEVVFPMIGPQLPWNQVSVG